MGTGYGKQHCLGEMGPTRRQVSTVTDLAESSSLHSSET